MSTRPHDHRRWIVGALVALAALGVTAAAISRTTRSDADGRSGPTPTAAPTTTTFEVQAPLPGAMAGLTLEGLEDEALRSQVIAAADAELGRASSARDPFGAESVDDPFVDDALAAHTLALAGMATGDDRYHEAAARLVDDWVTTVTATEGTCTDNGGCQTSLVLSRAAPALVYASNLLDAAGKRTEAERARFHRWMGDIALPAASRRNNNWGDAGTYLRAVAAVEIGDEDELDGAIEQWRHGLDLIAADGHIPEETRRDKAGLMYSQEALSYKVAVAELAQRQGIDLWEEVGAGGASLLDALSVTAEAIRDPSAWRWHDDPRVPTAAPMWVLASQRWPDVEDFEALASAATAGNGRGHSGVVWTAATASP